MPDPVAGLTIITNAYREIGRADPDGRISNEDTDFGFTKLNHLLSTWRTLRQFVYAIVSASYPFVTSQQSYTLGLTGNFVAVRPNKIVRANLVKTALTPAEHVRLEVLDIEHDYPDNALPNTSGAEPAVLYVRKDYPNLTLIPYPFPEAGNTEALANQLELFTWSPLSSFADLVTVYDLPDGYEPAIHLTLAETLCSSKGKTVPPELAENARNARVAIQSLNTSIPRMATDGSALTDAQRANLGRWPGWPNRWR